MTFPIYETHPELADALRSLMRGWKIPYDMHRELRFHGLLSPEGDLTGISKMILKEDPDVDHQQMGARTR